MLKISQEKFDVHYCQQKECNNGTTRCIHSSPDGCTHPVNPRNQDIPRIRWGIFDNAQQTICYCMAINARHALKVARNAGIILTRHATALPCPMTPISMTRGS